ncbi:UbiA family prenyltransferase [Nakamurella deserti]|uniref:UbiA family prenyltransferase n=1 Tax=Nakamurella deserti TaxID=2164074 RepID=UPI000DBE1174|nr:UbiA family prenyltransferase [Nakamurella deserti]
MAGTDAPRPDAAPGTSPAAVVRGLAGACHPAPTVAVTTLTTALAVGAGTGAGTVVLILLAVLAGQLSIGWSNDWLDAARDREVARTDKPVAAGTIPVGVVRTAALAALVAAVLLSAPLGGPAAAVHLLAVVGSGWLYNLGLKRIWASWVPYVVCFGLLPAVVTLSTPGRLWPPGWAMAAGALLGFGAHLANVLPDLDDDAATGVRGFPHRLGRTRTAVLAPVALGAATVCVVFGPPGAPGVLGVVVLVSAVGTAVAAAMLALTRPGGRAPFLLTLAVAALDVVVLVASGTRLT